MIRIYQEKDFDEMIDARYQASLLAHDFLDEAFFQAEREAFLNSIHAEG